MDHFIQAQGQIWLPHIMRRLANRFADACDTVFPAFGITVPPGMVSTVHLLFDRGPRSVTDIAAVTHQSHPLINKYVQRLKGLGLVETRADPKDGRRTIVTLTREGERQATLLLDARPSFNAAYARLMLEADADIFDALWRIEDALEKTPFADRIMAERGTEADGEPEAGVR